MCWALVPAVLRWLFLCPSFPFLAHQSEHGGSGEGQNIRRGESLVLLGFKPVLAKCELQTETSLGGLVNTRTPGCCWTGMLFRRAGARDPAGLFTGISGGASHGGGFSVWSAESLEAH